MLENMPRFVNVRDAIARVGIVAFAASLLLPTLLAAASRADRDVLVAGANEVRANAIARRELLLPNQVAYAPRRVVTLAPAPAPTIEEPARAPIPPPAVLAPDGPGVLVTASWYGPGFYENRLPCWRWLQASGLPIQLLPDGWGVAHKTLPCGTLLVLSHGAITITVPVVDRGPYVAGREIDMSALVKAALGCTDLCTVLMQIRQ